MEKINFNTPGPERIISTDSKKVDEVDQKEINLNDEEYLDYLKDLEINDPSAYNTEIDRLVIFLENEHNKNVPEEKIEIPDDKDNPGEEYYGRFIDFNNGTLKNSKLNLKVEKIKKSKDEQAKAKEIAIAKAIAKRKEINSRNPLINPLDPLL